MKHVLFSWLLAVATAFSFSPGILVAQTPVAMEEPAEDKEPGQEGTEGEATEGKEEEEEWDVSQPPLPTYEIDIDTQEGTWMSLDVSPAGDEIVFDLLGDIYRLAIEGGEAEALTDGLAWDMHPRFSPDGKSIAFTSDRAGGDNIWTMARDGSNPQAVSEESFRLLNSPAWDPEGEFIAAHKHFSSRRSLGSGEIWLYHRSGGEGVQMTVKPNEQKDVGEPAFSPDGRYLYFSQDVTPGDVFEYSKDSNGQIYAIRRLDRETGEIDNFITGPGGAIRPTPSPDGRYVAFVRRVRFVSTLFLKDLRSGAEFPVYSPLERDMQETWAIHGVYPSMAWTPDSTGLVFWSQGKIRRLDIATKEAVEIPFRVRARHTMLQAARFPQEATSKTFRTHMLRWVQVSPDGSQVVFQTLGHLYVRSLPNGKARRLTDQQDHYEFFPSYSRDGKWIAYTTWNDQQLGTVRIVAASGGKGRVLTSEPGHYSEPVISPDGSTMVFNKLEGGWLRPPTWSAEPGIYRVALEAGNPTGKSAGKSAGKAKDKPRRILDEGSSPQFGASSDRIYLRAIRGERKPALISVGLDGTEMRTHLLTDWATEFSVSPDERWVAFQERFQAYIAPLPRNGKEVHLGPKSKSLPLHQVSRDAGESLHWSGDGESLYWALGSELYQRSLPEVFTFLDGAPEEALDPPEQGIDLSFEVPTYTPDNTIALVGGRLITMDGNEIIEDGTLVIEGDRILAAGSRESVAVPPGAHIIELQGRTVLPGIIDVHWHGSQGQDEIIPQQNWTNYASLTFGVTTLHDPSNDTSEIFSAAEMARAGAIVAPRIFSTGTILYGAEAGITAIVDDFESAQTHLRRMKAAGAFSVKSYNQPRREQRQQVLKAARELNMLVVPEGGSLLQHNLTMIADGHTGIEHSIPVARIYDDVRQFWSQSETAYTPTLGVGYGGIFGENYWYEHTDVWNNQRLLTFVPQAQLDARARRPTKAPLEEYNHIANAQVANELAELGVGVQVGAHGQREGLAAHWEIWMLAQGGMSPHRALQAATLDGARYLGMEQDLGSLEVGKLADLMVLDQDPLENIRNSESVHWVMVGGRLFEAATMKEIGGKETTVEPFYFSDGGVTAGCSTAACAGPATSRCAH